MPGSAAGHFAKRGFMHAVSVKNLGRIGAVLILCSLLAPHTAFAACATPSGVAGDIVYNADFKVVQFCNGTNWVGMANSSSAAITALTGDVTGTGPGSMTATIANGVVTYAKIQNVSATNRLLGRASAGAGAVEEITLGTGLSFTGTTLNVSGVGATSSGATGYVQLSGGAGAFADSGTTAGQQLFWDDTNKRLGIGTTSPYAKLHIAGGGGSTTASLAFTNTDYADTTVGSALFGGLGATSGNTYFWLQAYTSGRAGVGNLALNALGGNVGIGTTTPTTALQVVGGALTVTKDANWAAANLQAFSATPSHDGLLNLTHARGTAAAPTYVQSGDYLGTIVMRDHVNGVGAAIVGVATQTHSATVAGTKLVFDTTANGGLVESQAMTIDQSGYVGIGATSPVYKLDVSGDIRTNTNLYMSASSPAIYMDGDVIAPDGAPFKRITANDGCGNWNLRAGGYCLSNVLKYASAANGYAGITMNMESSVGTMSLQAGTAAAAAAGDAVTTKSLYLDGTGALSWDTSKLAILAGGNVGIGNASPGYPLDVTGAIRASSEIISTSANQFRMVQGNYGSFTRNDGANTFFLLTASGDQYGTYNSLRPFSFNDSTGNVAFANGQVTIAHATGNVGIGTANPTNQLSISTADTVLGLWSDPSNAYAAIEAHNVANSTKRPLVLNAWGGNVGLGTTNPIYGLDVAGGVRSQGGFAAKATGTYGAVALNSGNTTLPGYIEWRNPVADGSVGTRRGYMGWDASNVALNLENSSNFLINGGNVGINTSSVAAVFKLDVEQTGNNTAVYGYTTGNGGSAFGVWGNAPSYVGVYCSGALCGGTQAWTNFSDSRLKTDIRDLSDSNGLAAIERLRPVTFHWKDAATDAIKGEQLGFIAQEVAPIFPQLVATNMPTTTIKLGDGTHQTITNVKALSYAEIVVPLVKAIQELKGMFDSDHDALVTLKADNDNLRAMVEQQGHAFETYKAVHP